MKTHSFQLFSIDVYRKVNSIRIVKPVRNWRKYPEATFVREIETKDIAREHFLEEQNFPEQSFWRSKSLIVLCKSPEQ